MAAATCRLPPQVRHRLKSPVKSATAGRSRPTSKDAPPCQRLRHPTIKIRTIRGPEPLDSLTFDTFTLAKHLQALYHQQTENLLAGFARPYGNWARCSVGAAGLSLYSPTEATH